MTAFDGDDLALSADSPRKLGEYVVVARRYRPQDFTQLVGQSQVSQALANAINTSRVGHAYLFTGARGVGKTSTARIFAKALNCVRGPTTQPCGQCDICQGIASGGDVDVIEIDGASNRGIDEIRQLRSNVNIRPSRARFKIYIIDEVHMLTNQAFNALLKTLEEPPEHVKFIFCTTEADKIPITVLSRCQRFDFAPIELRSIVDRLQHICSSEGVAAEPEALQVIARRAAGSMRDSQSLLEQLLSFGGPNITVADVNAMLGTAGSARLAALAQCIAGRDAAAALAEIDAAVGEGVDLGQLTEQLLGYFRDAMAALVGCQPELLLHTSAAEHEAVHGVGQQIGLETLLAMAQILDQTLSRMRQSTHVRTLAEVALVRLCKLDDLDELPTLISQLRNGTVAAGAESVAAPTNRASRTDTRAEQPVETVRNVALPAAHEVANEQAGRDSDLNAPAQKKTPENAASSALAAPPALDDDPPLDAQTAVAAWRQALKEIGDMTADFAGRAESVAISGPNRLAVRFRKAYTQALQFCERPERRQRLEQTLSRIAGRTLRIDFGLIAEDGAATPGNASPPRPSVTRRQRQSEFLRHPLIRKALELFDTEIVTVLDAPPPDESGLARGESAS